MKPLPLHIGILLLLLTFNTNAQEVQTFNLHDAELFTRNRGYSQPIILEQGQSLEVLNVVGESWRTEISVYMQTIEAETLGENDRTWSEGDFRDQIGSEKLSRDQQKRHEAVNKTFYGPLKIQFGGSIGNPATIVSYRINRPSTEDSSSDTDAGSAVKIPEGATGDVQVVMESSADGKTWVLAGPGPYPANGSKRQFRLRIIKPE